MYWISQCTSGRWFIFSSLTEKIESQPTGARREVRMTATCAYACHINVSLLIQGGGSVGFFHIFTSVSPKPLLSYATLGLSAISLQLTEYYMHVHYLCRLNVHGKHTHTPLTTITEIWHWKWWIVQGVKQQRNTMKSHRSVAGKNQDGSCCIISDGWSVCSLHSA